MHKYVWRYSRFAQSKTVSRDQQKMITVRFWMHLAWRSWRIHDSISSARGYLAQPINAESDIVREKMRGKQTKTRLGTRPPAYYDVTGTYRYIPPGHTNKCSHWFIAIEAHTLQQYIWLDNKTHIRTSPLLPLHTLYLLPLKLSNKLKLPLLRLKEYRILPYSLVNNSEDARVKQH